MKRKVSIAIIDDDAALASNLKDILEAEGYSVEAVDDARAGIALFNEKMFDLALVDIKLPHIPGPELISRLSRLRPETEYVMITGHATMETAIEAVRQKQIIGYENKPIDMERLLMFIRQVIHRRRAEEALRISEANYLTIFDTANDAIFIYDFGSGRIIDVNRKMCEMYGYTVEEARRIDVDVLSEGVPPYSQKEAMEWIQKAADGIPQIFEWKARDKDGKLFWVEVNLKRTTIGNEDRLLAIIRDINERKRAEEERITHLQTLTYLNQIISSSLETDEVLGEIAKAAARLMNAPIVTIWTADETTQILEAQAFSDERMDEDFRLRKLLFGQGGVGWVAANRQPINVPDVFVDKRVTNLDWWQTRGLKSFFGFPIFLEQTLIAVLGLGGQEPFRIGPEDQSLLENLAAQAAIAVKNARLFEEIRKQTVKLEQINTELRREITNRKQAEEERTKLQNQLQQTQKMEAVGTLAGGIAHQFNNALSPISVNLDMLEMDYPGDEKIANYTKQMKDSAHRMAQLTSQLLAYAKGGKYQAETITINDFMDHTLPIIHPSINPDIGIETDLTTEVMNIKVDQTQMQMVLSAILVNASEAMEGKGVIRISTKEEDIDEDFSKYHSNLKPGRYVCIKVEDNGKGMDKETRSRIFEPFFTTKFEGRGLGMASAFGIVRNHDGLISVYSEIGRGTVVRIYLPLIDATGCGGYSIDGPAQEILDAGAQSFIQKPFTVAAISEKLNEALGGG